MEVQFQTLAIGDKFKSAYEADNCVFEKIDNERAKLIENNWVNRASGRIVMRVGEESLLCETEMVVRI